MADTPNALVRSTGDDRWTLQTEALSLVWEHPPVVLGVLLAELFDAKPQDVLHWMLNAVWRLQTSAVAHGAVTCLSPKAVAAPTPTPPPETEALVVTVDDNVVYDSSVNEDCSLVPKVTVEDKVVCDSSVNQDCSLVPKVTVDDKVIYDSSLNEDSSLVPRMSVGHSSSEEQRISSSSGGVASNLRLKTPQKELRLSLNSDDTLPAGFNRSSLNIGRGNAAQDSEHPLVDVNRHASSATMQTCGTDKSILPVLDEQKTVKRSFRNAAPSLHPEQSRRSEALLRLSMVALGHQGTSCNSPVSSQSLHQSTGWTTHQTTSCTTPSQRGTMSWKTTCHVKSDDSRAVEYDPATDKSSTYGVPNDYDRSHQIIQRNSQIVAAACAVSGILDQSSRFVVRPASLMRLVWSFIIFTFILMEVFATPYVWVFYEAAETWWYHSLDVALIVVFSTDLVYNFFVADAASEEFFTSVSKIGMQYLTTRFPFDLIMLVLDIISFAVGRRIVWLRVLKLARSFRLNRVPEVISNFVNYFNLQLYSTFLLQLVILNILWMMISHAFVVVWYIMGDPAQKEEDGYLIVFRKVHTALIGGGDSSSIFETRQQLGIVFLVVRVFVIVISFLCVLQVVQSLIADMRTTDEDRASLYMKQRGISAGLQLQVQKAWRLFRKAKNHSRTFEQIVDHEMPFAVKTELLMELFGQSLHSLELLSELMDFNHAFGRDLVHLVYEIAMMPGTVLYRENVEQSSTIYHILTGRVLTTSSCDLAKGTEHSSGMWIGVGAILNPFLPRNETAVCLKYCELMAIPSSHFHELLEEHNLDTYFEQTLKRSLWLGLCGRCGKFGDHLPRDCPLLSRAFSNSFRLTHVWRHASQIQRKLSSAIVGEQPHVDKQLLTYLGHVDMEWLAADLNRYGITCLQDLSDANKMKLFLADPKLQLSDDEADALSPSQVQTFLVTIENEIKNFTKENAEVSHVMFISHYKVEAGTEAALMHDELRRLIAEDPSLSGGRDHAHLVFVDSECLRDVDDLKEHVMRSKVFLLLLTKNVLSRPWCLIEIITATKVAKKIVLVEVQRAEVQFVYPDADFYSRLRNGEQLSEGAKTLITEQGYSLEEAEQALWHVFKSIALPFSPHKSSNIRRTELNDIIDACKVKEDEMAPCSVVGSSNSQAFSHFSPLQSIRQTFSAHNPSGNCPGQSSHGSSKFIFSSKRTRSSRHKVIPTA